MAAKKSGGAGLYANIHKKQERISHGSGEHMRKAGEKGAPSAKAFSESEKTSKSKSSKASGSRSKKNAAKKSH